MKVNKQINVRSEKLSGPNKITVENTNSFEKAREKKSEIEDKVQEVLYPNVLKEI